MNSLTDLLRKLNAISEQQVNEEKCDECGMDPCTCDHVDESAKPDFADIDGDGDKEEDMKKAAKDKEELDECGMPMSTEMSPMSSVGDTSPMAAVIAPGIAADQMGAEPEAAMEPEMAPEVPEEKASYSLSIRNGDSTLTMTTDAPDEIIHVMKLAGVKGEAKVEKADPKQEQPAGQEEVEEEFENTPAVTGEKEPRSFGDIRDWGRKGTGKGNPNYPGTKASGDNPLSEEAILEDYKAFKGSK